MKASYSYSMTINGERVTTDAQIDVTNPADGRAFATAPDASREDLDSAVDAARTAFRTWKQVDVAERQAMLRKAGDLLAEHADELSRIFTLEQGRPIGGAKQEIEGAAAWLHAVAEMAPPVEVVEDSDAQYIETRYVPVGVVCAIAPWNFPVMLSMWKVAPALLAGNTMVLKPSPFTPLCTLRIGELFNGVLPPGVLNVVSGGDELGPWMTSHPGFDKISFTGSTETGKRVMASAAPDLKRLTLELGGNDAAIVMPDVDVDAVAEKIFFGAFFNTAQVCVATKRLYAHVDVYEALRDRLTTIAAKTKIGNGSDQGVDLGPIQNQRQYERVIDLIEDAKRSNLKLLQGPEVPESGGYFVPITIVDNPPDDSRVVQEEAFGPILPMMRFDDIDEVVERANASEYGLAGSIWSNDHDAAIAMARRMETGTIWINQNLNLRPDTPFAGHKHSGVGVENGMKGLLEYMVPQTVYLAR